MQTMRAWAADPAVLELAGRLKQHSLEAGGSYIEHALVSLEAMRRLNLQKPEDQGPALERLAAQLAAAGWRCPVKDLARLLWLSAPSRLAVPLQAFAALRARCGELDGADLAFVVTAMNAWSVETPLKEAKPVQKGLAFSEVSQIFADDFIVSMNLTPKTAEGDWACIVAFERKDGTGNQPGLYLAPASTRLVACVGPPEEEEASRWQPAPGLSSKDTSRVTLRVSGSVCEVRVNGTRACSAPWRVDGDPRRLTAGGSGSHKAANTVISGLRYRQLLGGAGFDPVLLERVTKRLQDPARSSGHMFLKSGTRLRLVSVQVTLLCNIAPCAHPGSQTGLVCNSRVAAAG